MANSGKVTSGPYWTQNWIEAMWRFTSERFVNFDTGVVDYEALGREEYEFRKALFYRNFKNSPRAKTAFDEAAADYTKKVQNGSKGGRPKKEETSTAAETPSEVVDEEMTHRTAAVRPNSSKRYPTKDEVYTFAQDRCLDEADAREWFEIHAARGFKDKDGHPINSWQGAVTMYCISKMMKRAV